MAKEVPDRLQRRAGRARRSLGVPADRTPGGENRADIASLAPGHLT